MVLPGLLLCRRISFSSFLWVLVGLMESLPEVLPQLPKLCLPQLMLLLVSIFCSVWKRSLLPSVAGQRWELRARPPTQGWAASRKENLQEMAATFCSVTLFSRSCPAMAVPLAGLSPAGHSSRSPALTPRFPSWR